MVGNFDQDFLTLLSFLKAETEDRTLAIVCASYAETYLGELIKYRLPGLNHDLRNKMFHPSHGILGTFSGRIDMAKALNSIDTDMYHDLKLLASIRNRFAHDLSIQFLSHPETSKRIDQFRNTPKLATPDLKLEQSLRENWAALHYRGKFEIVGTQICMALHNALNAVQTAIKAEQLRSG